MDINFLHWGVLIIGGSASTEGKRDTKNEQFQDNSL
ncbi:hypothetical protein VII00023_20637 [Vibrio ichthyoenteri ATCC 700023]|uniref:Uncharacterized protein n=1 Tax=Vibrio ichthyoenteri ATCC 700023 TaxID=870968 RepID=F9S7U0_9VIBR|nr:hypothetical protein VII00023_20637 [Vibrio ichthyoenteri ATCC 700023]